MSEIKKSKYNEPADIVIYVKDRGIVLREKSLIAIDKKKCKTAAVGNEAEGLDQDRRVRGGLQSVFLREYVRLNLKHMWICSV